MSSSDEGGSSCSTSQKRFRGIRLRKWGKWVSEIRVPGTQDRLWLGSYAAPEAAAMAHDVAYYCLRENASLDDFNFPLMLPAGVQRGMSPRSVQKAATDAGMAVDAQMIAKRPADSPVKVEENVVNSRPEERFSPCGNDGFSDIPSWDGKEFSRELGDQALNISVDDYL
ncbi:ethylene-responsive transcription factor ERF020-like [Coffea arabica]|uniref:Ethylene-responsive transcription factor ERF020-like n=1 Tax=Coffea arabica TaxID=13443 RepID=A0ABM4W0L4_COFAR